MYDFPTGSEQYWYDKGFENAKDYWQPLERQKIIDLLNSQVTTYEDLLHDVDALGPLGTRYLSILTYLDYLIKLIEVTE